MSDPIYERGMRIRREVLGDEHVDAAIAGTTEFTADFQDLITRYAWGEIWGRPELDRRTRSCMALTALVALGRFDELPMHVRAALRNGLSREEIADALLQSAVYCGVPAANSAFAVAQRTLRELPSDGAPIETDDALRQAVATACRILAVEGLSEGILGHVSARVGERELLIRCRGPHERGLAFTEVEDIRRVDLDGNGEEVQDGWSPPKELPIHAELYRARPDVRAVVHAHPPAALLCGLAGLQPRPVFGAYNIPAMRLARDGVPVYPRPVLITRAELAGEMLAAMEGRSVCLLAGHGITVAGDSVEQATVRAVDLNVALSVTVELARLGASPPDVAAEDLAELPDLGSRFNDELVWRWLEAKASPQ